MKEILFEQKVKKVSEDRFVFERNFKAELTDKEVESNVINIKKNIETIKLLLDNVDIDNELKKEEVKLSDNKKVKEDALKNYEKYMNEKIVEMKRNAPKDKMKIQAFLNKFEEFKVKHLESIKLKFEAEKKQLQKELEQNTESLKAYEDSQ